MDIEIISTGEEILYGAIADENAAYIARTLVERGFEIVRHGCVGDGKKGLVELFTEADGRSDVVIVTGGLGPTVDDRTAEAAADAFGAGLVFSKDAERSVTAFFEKRGKPVPDSNKKQLQLPRGATCLENPVGTAPGFTFFTGKSRFYFLPGVPFEMRRLMDDHVIPALGTLVGQNRDFFQIRTMSHFGVAEAEVDRRLLGIESIFPGIRLGLRAVFPVIQVKLYARGEDQRKIRDQIDAAQHWVLERTGEFVFSTQDRSMAEEVGQCLIRQKKTLALAESCTGGLIGHMLTNVAGSSDYFLFSGVTYANQAKVRILGVDESVLQSSGAVSEKTVCAMADGARAVSGADIGLATSGIAGPGGGSEEKPVGTVFVGLSTDKGTHAFEFCHDFGDRIRNKTLFAMTALDLLRRKLLEESPGVHG